MNTDYEYRRIVKCGDLLKKYFDGELTSSERRELARWLWEERRNREFFQRLCRQTSLKTYYASWRKIDPLKEYDLLERRMIGKTKKRRLLVWRWAAVVSFLFLSSIGWYLFRTAETETSPVVSDRKDLFSAVLKTSDGKVIYLDGNKESVFQLESRGVHVSDSLKELVYQTPLTEDSLIWHQLDIPRGGEYKLVLSDGTQVWLNSESTIRFPVSFARESREISVTGEVYLEVVHDTLRPFRVKAGEGCVEVLGTAFGMTVYPLDSIWSTTLVQGSVRASWGDQSRVLMPHRKVFVKGGELLEKEVDVENELGWVQGIFVFEHEPLEEVVKKLERWYDVEFRFNDDKLRKYLFTGKVSRDVGIKQILELMERMNIVSFEQKENFILIKEKAGHF